MSDWKNFGDVSPEHGQVWLKKGDDDYAEVVVIYGGSDVGLADNQYMIETGTVFIDHDKDEEVLECAGWDNYEDDFLSLAYCHYLHSGMDWVWQNNYPQFVQVGKELDDYTACGTTCEAPDVVLHGNASISKYIAENFLQ